MHLNMIFHYKPNILSIPQDYENSHGRGLRGVRVFPLSPAAIKAQGRQPAWRKRFHPRPHLSWRVMADRGRISGPCRSENHREMMGQYGITYLCLVGNGGMIHNISIIIPATPIPIQSLLSTSKINMGKSWNYGTCCFSPINGGLVRWENHRFPQGSGYASKVSPFFLPAKTIKLREQSRMRASWSNIFIYYSNISKLFIYSL